MAVGLQTAEGEALAEPLHTEPATHSVLASLREMIVTGQIAANAPLRAEGLAAQLGVSRTPIRNALAVLSAEGLVNYGVNRGYTARAVSIDDVLDSIEVRASLEAMAARLFVERGGEPQVLDAMRRAVASARMIVDRGDWSEEIEAEWYHLNWVFHRSIHHGCHNSVLRAAIRMTLIYPIFGDALRLCPSIAANVPARLRQIPTATPPHIAASQADHERLLTAIESGDSGEAERLMSGHVLATKQRLNDAVTRS